MRSSAQELPAQIAAAQKQADLAKKIAKAAKAAWREARQRYKDARRAAKKAKKVVKELKADFAAASVPSPAGRKRAVARRRRSPAVPVTPVEPVMAPPVASASTSAAVPAT